MFVPLGMHFYVHLLACLPAFCLPLLGLPHASLCSDLGASKGVRAMFQGNSYYEAPNSMMVVAGCWDKNKLFFLFLSTIYPPMWVFKRGTGRRFEMKVGLKQGRAFSIRLIPRYHVEEGRGRGRVTGPWFMHILL